MNVNRYSTLRIAFKPFQKLALECRKPKLVILLRHPFHALSGFHGSLNHHITQDQWIRSRREALHNEFIGSSNVPYTLLLSFHPQPYAPASRHKMPRLRRRTIPHVCPCIYVHYHWVVSVIVKAVSTRRLVSIRKRIDYAAYPKISDCHRMPFLSGTNEGCIANVCGFEKFLERGVLMSMGNQSLSRFWLFVNMRVNEICVHTRNLCETLSQNKMGFSLLFAAACWIWWVSFDSVCNWQLLHIHLFIALPSYHVHLCLCLRKPCSPLVHSIVSRHQPRRRNRGVQHVVLDRKVLLAKTNTKRKIRRFELSGVYYLHWRKKLES